jgi:hypothetical protein
LPGCESAAVQMREASLCRGQPDNSLGQERASVSSRLVVRAAAQVMDALAMTFPDNTFDLVWACESGEHMPDKKRCVAVVHCLPCCFAAFQLLDSGTRVACSCSSGLVQPELQA